MSSSKEVLDESIKDLEKKRDKLSNRIDALSLKSTRRIIKAFAQVNNIENPFDPQSYVKFLSKEELKLFSDIFTFQEDIMGYHKLSVETLSQEGGTNG